MTVIENVAVWVIPPPVPVTVTVLVPSAALVDAPNWRVAPGAANAPNETGACGSAVIPVGKPESAKLIVPANPFKDLN